MIDAAEPERQVRGGGFQIARRALAEAACRKRPVDRTVGLRQAGFDPGSGSHSHLTERIADRVEMQVAVARLAFSA